MKTYIVIRAQTVGDMESGYSEMFSTSGESYINATRAHQAGWAATGCDDYIVGVLEDGVLVAFDALVDDPERVAAAAKELCLTEARRPDLFPGTKLDLTEARPPKDEPKYKIASAIRSDTLEDLVGELMRGGWVPQGGVSHSNHFYLQAMVRTPVNISVYTAGSDDNA